MQKEIISRHQLEVTLQRLACQLVENHRDFSSTVLVGIQRILRACIPAASVEFHVVVFHDTLLLNYILFLLYRISHLLHFSKD